MQLENLEKTTSLKNRFDKNYPKDCFNGSTQERYCKILF